MRSPGQRPQQGRGVVAAAVHDAVDEQGGGALHLTRGHSAFDVLADVLRGGIAGPAQVEQRESSPSSLAYRRRSSSASARCRANSSACMSQNLPCSAAASAAVLAANACGWIVVSGNPVRVPDAPVQLALDLLDLGECPPRVRAFVVPVHEDEPCAGRAADVVGHLVHRRHVLRAAAAAASETHHLTDEDDVDAAGQLLVDLEHLADRSCAARRRPGHGRPRA